MISFVYLLPCREKAHTDKEYSCGNSKPRRKALGMEIITT